MAKFKNDKGLTLIELLITIAVLAVVSAIALPVINNVVAASNSNAYNQTIKDAQTFIDKYSKAGIVAYDGLTNAFKGYVDTDSDNIIDANELVDTLTLDAKYSATATGSATVGGLYSTGGVTAATIIVSSGSAAPAPTPTPTATTPAIVTYSSGDAANAFSWAWKNGGPVFAGGARSLQIIDVSQTMGDALMSKNVGDQITLDGVVYTLADGNGTGSKGFLQIDISWPNGSYRYGMIFLLGPDWGDNGYINSIAF